MTLDEAIDEATDILLYGEEKGAPGIRKVPIEVLYPIVAELIKEDDE